MLRASITALLASQLLATSAFACETVEYRPTPAELTRDARAYFEQQEIIYEGALLGAHDYETGGRFLVLKVYKGAARPFQIIELPGGTSCYGGVSPFSIGFLSNHQSDLQSFDGLVAGDYVKSWAKQGLVEDGPLAASNLFRATLIFVAALPFATIGGLLRRRSRRAALQNPHRSMPG